MFNEKEVIGRILAGDLKAFESLVKQYEKLVFHVVSRLVSNSADIEDICQEVFIKVYKHLSGFRFESRFSTWVARVAYHTTLNQVKKHQRERAVHGPADLENFHFTNEDPERIFARKDISAYINELMEQLPEQYRTVLTLYHLNEFSYQEIEEITDMPEGTVKSYLFRARKLMKEKLEVYLKNELI